MNLPLNLPAFLREYEQRKTVTVFDAQIAIQNSSVDPCESVLVGQVAEVAVHR